MLSKIHLPPHLLLERNQLGAGIRRLRDVRGWTQDDLAEHSGLHRNTIVRIETGARRLTIDAYPARRHCSGRAVVAAVSRRVVLGCELWPLFCPR